MLTSFYVDINIKCPQKIHLHFWTAEVLVRTKRCWWKRYSPGKCVIISIYCPANLLKSVSRLSRTLLWCLPLPLSLSRSRSINKFVQPKRWTRCNYDHHTDEEKQVHARYTCHRIYCICMFSKRHLKYKLSNDCIIL